MAPPAAPPMNSPIACVVLYTPSAAPLAAGGAVRDTSDGKVASRILKATKKSSSQKASYHRLPPRNSKPSWTTATKAIATRNTCRILSFFSAAMIAGTMTTKETSTAGK